MKISVRQIKAARALLAWSQEDLATQSGISYPTIARLETSDGELGGRADTASKITEALQAAGIIFVAENGEGAGVRLRKTPESVAELTRRIDAIEDDLATIDAEPPKTPKGGMQRLESAHKHEAVKKLKNRRTKLKK